MFKHYKYALTILAALTLSACGGGDEPQPEPNPEPTEKIELPVYVQGSTSDLLGINTPTTKSLSNRLVVCIDSNSNQSCEKEEVYQYTDSKGKAVLSWDATEDFSGKKVIAVNPLSQLYLHYSIDQIPKIGDNYQPLYLSTLTSLQDVYGSPDSLATALGSEQIIDYSKTDITQGTYVDANTQAKTITALNDSLYQMGMGSQNVSTESDVASKVNDSYSSVSSKIDEGFSVDEIVNYVSVNETMDLSNLNKSDSKAPVVSFTHSANELTVTFVNNTTDPENDELSYHWEFGDGEKSTEKNPVHTYKTKGSYVVKLIAVDSTGKSASESLSIQVSNKDEPIANHVPLAAFTVKINGLSVTITDTSFDEDEDILSYSWDMGDGQTRRDSKGFTYTYKEAGTYTIQLVVDDGLAASEPTTFEVTVSGGNVPSENHAPVADFTAKTDGLSVTITDKSSDVDGDILTYTWDMGDGKQLNHSKGFTYNYSEKGDYTIKLVVNDGLVSSEAKTVNVTVQGAIDEDPCQSGVCSDECPQFCDDPCESGVCSDECPQNCDPCASGECSDECPQNCDPCASGECSDECPENCQSDDLKCTLE
jgi:PKD repeat protein